MSVITKQAIIEASLRLIDDEGAQALTMRKLAVQLNIEAPSLYYHIKNKGQLCQLLVDTLVTRSIASAEPAVTIRKSVINVALAYRSILRAHPGVVPLAVLYPVSFVTVSQYIGRTQPQATHTANDVAQYSLLSVFTFVAGQALAEANKEAISSQPNANATHYEQWFMFGLDALTTPLNMQA